MDFIEIPATRIPLIAEADVVVVGGGPAGFAAGLHAARAGAETVIVERLGSPGGMMTNGLMSVFVGEHLGDLQAEMHDRLGAGGHVVEPLKRYPELRSNPLFHYYGPNILPGRETASSVYAFDPHMAAVIMNGMMEENGVRPLLRTLCVGAKVEGESIRAVIVEDASGRKAIGGKVFVDATGRGDLAARCGVPCRGPGDEKGIPIAPGLMWKMGNVDYERLFEYLEKDPFLERAMKRAEAEGRLPPYRPKRMDLYGGAYSGHPHPEMCPTPHPGEMLLWAPAPREWGLDCAQRAGDLTRAEIELRKHISAEAGFLKRYVQGFENAYLASIAPWMGIREGRHPEGEYVIGYEDIRNQRRFHDAALRRTVPDWYDTSQGVRIRSFDIPYRCFLAAKVENLLLAGDNLSMEHEALLHIRGFGMALRTGEVAGTGAARSLKAGVRPKELQWNVILQP
jgi:hypothetical protein